MHFWSRSCWPHARFCNMKEGFWPQIYLWGILFTLKLFSGQYWQINWGRGWQWQLSMESITFSKMEGDIFVFQTLFLANHLVVTIALSADVSNVTIRYLSPYISIRSALSVFPHRGFVNLIVRKSNLCFFGYNPNSVGSNPNSLVYRSVISDWEWFIRIQILVVPQRVRLK